jgi:hypothetical protein
VRRAVYQKSVLAENVEFLGHIARLCTNPVGASFGEEERWTSANAEENAAAMEIENAEENAARLEIEANEVLPAPWYVFAFVECSYPFVCICSLFYLCLIILFVNSREKGPRDEETEETEVQPSSEGLEFEAMAFDGFEPIREEDDGVIFQLFL